MLSHVWILNVMKSHVKVRIFFFKLLIDSSVPRRHLGHPEIYLYTVKRKFVSTKKNCSKSLMYRYLKSWNFGIYKPRHAENTPNNPQLKVSLEQHCDGILSGKFTQPLFMSGVSHFFFTNCSCHDRRHKVIAFCWKKYSNVMLKQQFPIPEYIRL